MFLGFFLRFKHLPGCRNIQVRDWLDCWSCIFYFLDLVPIKMGQDRSLGHCGNSWTFYNDCLYFSFISYYLVCVCLHNHHHYTIHFFVVGLTCVWLARPITINASFVLNCRGQQHHSQTSGEQRCDGVFWIVPFIEKKFHLRKQCRVLCVWCCLNVLWSHLYMLFDVIFCCSLFVARFVPIHSDSFQFTLLLSVETILHWGIAPSRSDPCTTGGQK